MYVSKYFSEHMQGGAVSIHGMKTGMFQPMISYWSTKIDNDTYKI